MSTFQLFEIFILMHMFNYSRTRKYVLLWAKQQYWPFLSHLSEEWPLQHRKGPFWARIESIRSELGKISESWIEDMPRTHSGIIYVMSVCKRPFQGKRHLDRVFFLFFHFFSYTLEPVSPETQATYERESNDVLKAVVMSSRAPRDALLQDGVVGLPKPKQNSKGNEMWGDFRFLIWSLKLLWLTRIRLTEGWVWQSLIQQFPECHEHGVKPSKDGFA